MVNLIQLEITDFYCSSTDFADREYHVDRLYRSTLNYFKIKFFKLMFHHVRAQTHRLYPQLPQGWHEFGAKLPRSHVLHEKTFQLIMETRFPTITELQNTGYNQMSANDIEIFDQGTIEDYLATVFTVQDFALANGQVM